MGASSLELVAFGSSAANQRLRGLGVEPIDRLRAHVVVASEIKQEVEVLGPYLVDHVLHGDTPTNRSQIRWAPAGDD